VRLVSISSNFLSHWLAKHCAWCFVDDRNQGVDHCTTCHHLYNKGQSILVDAATWWIANNIFVSRNQLHVLFGGSSPNLTFSRGWRTPIWDNVLLEPVSVSAKWPPNPSNILCRFHEHDRQQTDRPHYGKYVGIGGIVYAARAFSPNKRVKVSVFERQLSAVLHHHVSVCWWFAVMSLLCFFSEDCVCFCLYRLQCCRYRFCVAGTLSLVVCWIFAGIHFGTGLVRSLNSTVHSW